MVAPLGSLPFWVLRPCLSERRRTCKRDQEASASNPWYSIGTPEDRRNRKFEGPCVVIKTDGFVRTRHPKELAMTQSESLATRHNALYQEALKVLRDVNAGTPRKSPTRAELQAVDKGCALLDKVLVLNPANWAACWTQGVAFRNVRRRQEAAVAFSRAYQINPNNCNVARELSLALLELSRFEDAIPIAERAMQLAPSDPGLIANYAVALHRAGRAAQARAEIERAWAMDSKDAITGQAFALITGRRPA
jgi:tetratricopeptide (TPR) repeat protein